MTIWRQTDGSKFDLHPEARVEVATLLGYIRTESLLAIGALRAGQVPGSEVYVEATIAHYQAVIRAIDWLLSRLDQKFDAFRLEFSKCVVKPIIEGKKGRQLGKAVTTALVNAYVASLTDSTGGGCGGPGGARELGPGRPVGPELPDQGSGGEPGNPEARPPVRRRPNKRQGDSR